MVSLSQKSLLALIWTSAALATRSPLLAERIESRDLEIRQNMVACPNEYESKNGMGFTTYCSQNNPFNDAIPAFKTNTMQECMERCSRFWGDGEGCFGVVWTASNNNCWIRNSTTGTAGLVDDKDNHAALVIADDMKALDTTCPETDLSSHSLPGVEGLGYTVHCGKVIGDNDLCFSGYPSCLESPFIGFYHAKSLEECLQFCIDEHPLCRAVSYNPGLEIGFANCWPKTGFPTTLSDPPQNMGILHSATITTFDRVDTKCPEQDYVAKNSKNFEIHCGQSNSGVNITSIHTQNISACMDACSTSDKDCVGVLFDSTLAGGFKNCYLQNTTSVSSNLASATYAALSGTAAPTSTGGPGSGSNNGNSSDGESSKAWIAGPVIGGIAAIALIAGGFFLWRRRKARAATTGVIAEKDHDYTGPAPAYSAYQPAPQEVSGDYAREIGSSEFRPTTKYAQRTQPVQAPQELPS